MTPARQLEIALLKRKVSFSDIMRAGGPSQGTMYRLLAGNLGTFAVWQSLSNVLNWEFEIVITPNELIQQDVK
uniref:Uncharacterized protein n=1 Tax=viral metagenome TaxID=1070528 RepID=A0A6M3LH47_9ZZZZ